MAGNAIIEEVRVYFLPENVTDFCIMALQKGLGLPVSSTVAAEVQRPLDERVKSSHRLGPWFKADVMVNSGFVASSH